MILDPVTYTDACRASSEWESPTSFQEVILTSKTSMEPSIDTTGIYELATGIETKKKHAQPLSEEDIL